MALFRAMAERKIPEGVQFVVGVLAGCGAGYITGHYLLPDNPKPKPEWMQKHIALKEAKAKGVNK